MNAPDRKPLVLFLCTGNSARSQMAEALLRRRAGDRFEVASAGLEPKGVNPLTLRVLAELGLPTAGMRSKPAAEFIGAVYVNYAIIVCEHANRSCPRMFPFTPVTLYWPIQDPAQFDGPEEERLALFRRVRDELSARIDAWLESLGEAQH